MKALVKKDFLMLMKQMKYVIIFFVAIALIFSTKSRDFLSGVLIVFAILPVTALAYDEQSKWDSLAVTMPYSSTQIVLSKFILGYIGSAFAMFLSTLMNIVIPYFIEKKIYTDALITTAVGQLICLIFMAIILAFSYRFGVQKGKILLLVLCAAAGVMIPIFSFVIYSSSSSGSKLLLVNDSDYLLPAAVFMIAVIINALSIIISIHNYKLRKFIKK